MATITYAFFIGGVTSRGKKGMTRESGNKKATRAWWQPGNTILRILILSWWKMISRAKAQGTAKHRVPS